jgi:hypothetical protein
VSGYRLTDDDRRMLRLAAAAPSAETRALVRLVERLTGEAVVSADEPRPRRRLRVLHTLRGAR